MTSIRHHGGRLARAALLATLPLASVTAVAQTPPRRLELSDTARNPRRADQAQSPAAPARTADDEHPYGPITPSRPTGVPANGAATTRESFVRDQTVLGVLVYAPAFATAVTRDPLAWTATYLVAGAATYFAAGQLSRDLAINEPTSWFATQAAVRGGLSGWALAASTSRPHRAGAIFLGSFGGAVSAVALGRGMSDGEVAGSVFGADLLAMGGLAATHVASPSANPGSRASVAAATSLLGYPLGYWYASRAPYRVTAGDVNTLWTSAAIGVAAAGTFVANGRPSAPVIATTLAAGLVGGTFLGDRLLVRRYDHSPEDGQLVALGALGGGAVGAGIGLLSGTPHDRLSARAAALTTVGAIGGVALAEHWRSPRSDAGTKLARLELNPTGVLAVATGMAGTHTLLHWTF